MTARTALSKGGSQRSAHRVAPFRTLPQSSLPPAEPPIAAGARVIHLHPCDGDGVPTLEAAPIAAAITAVRTACPGIPLSLSTWALIEPDPAHRRAQIAAWTVLPDLVTANQGEDGIVELCHDLLSRGVGIEAGLLELADAERFVSTDLAAVCTRVLIEPLDEDVEAAVAHGAAMEQVVTAAGSLRRCTTAKASPRGRSASVACAAVTACAPVSKTACSSPTDSRRRTTPAWSPRPSR